MRVGLMGMRQRPAVFHIAAQMQQLGTPPAAIFMDPKLPSEKDRRIWEERTGGRIADGDLDSLKVPLIDCSHQDANFADLVTKHRIDLLVSAATPGLVPRSTLTACPRGILNVHPGRLPQYRGCTCVEWAIFNDDQIGNSVHFMSEGFDEGAVVVVEDYVFTKQDRYIDIRVKVLAAGFSLLARATSDLMRTGNVIAVPQGPGQYYKPIPEDKMTEVLRKLQSEEYRYQL